MKTILLASLFLFALPSLAHAQFGQTPTQTATQFCQGGSCTYVPLEPLPGLPDCFGPNPSAKCTNPSKGSFASLISSSFKLLIGAGAFVAVVMIVLGALTYMFSDVIGDKYKAKTRIRNAMWGIVILVSSYLILNTINPDLVNFKLDFSALQTPSVPGQPSPAPAIAPAATTATRISAPPDLLLNSSDSDETRRWALANGYAGALTDSSGNVIGKKIGTTLDAETDRSMRAACDKPFLASSANGFKIAASCDSGSCTAFCATVQ